MVLRPFLFATFVGLLFILIREIDGAGLWPFLIALLALAAPIGIALAWQAALNQSRRLSILDQSGWLHLRLSGQILRLVLSTICAVAFAFFALCALLGTHGSEWIIVVLAGPALILAKTKMGDRLAAQWIAPHHDAVSLRVSSWAAAAMLTALHLCAVGFLSGSASPTLSPEKRIPDAVTPALAGSDLVAEIVGLSQAWDDLKHIAFGEIQNSGDLGQALALLLLSIGSFSFCWAMVCMCKAFVIPARELTRAIAPATQSTQPPPLTKTRIAWTSASVTFGALFVLLPLANALETSIDVIPRQDRPSTAAARLVSKAPLIFRRVERIGTDFHIPGTIGQIEAARHAFAVERTDAVAALDTMIGAAFQQVERNVDPFLDWYYTLPAEYARLGAILAVGAGGFERFLRDRLMEELEKGDPFGPLGTALNMGSKLESKAAGNLQRRIAAILETSQTSLAEGERADIVGERPEGFRTEHAPLGYALRNAVSRSNDRAMAAGGASALGASGLVTAYVGKKVAAKGAIKFAAKAAVKVAAGKAASGGAGATIGAVVGGFAGSVVPGAGTALGAAGGAALGAILVGVSVDALMLKLEENWRREEFRGELVAALHDAREEMRGDLLGETPTPAGTQRPTGEHGGL